MANSYIKSALTMAGGVAEKRSNAPHQYASRQKQYFGPETNAFAEKYAKYASDYMKAQIQGLSDGSLDTWETVYLRMADIGRPTSTTTKLTDDYKRVLIPGRPIDYLRPGTKIVTMGSTWLAINPNNISGVGAGGIVQRCNTVWNYLDWYGNVQSEPLAVDRYLSRANNTDTQEAMNLTKGYFDVKCQKNSATEQLAENSRMILGSNCYRITGFSDFTQEFTGDYTTVRMLEFSIHYEEPNLTIDDMENHVAGGKEFSWEIRIAGQTTLAAGTSAVMTAASQRNQEDVASSEEYPISYLWASSDESVATVDASGTVTAVAPGTCTITATLEQNTNWQAQIEVEVIIGVPVDDDETEAQKQAILSAVEQIAYVDQDGQELYEALENGLYPPSPTQGEIIRFMQTVPYALSLYESVTLNAIYYKNGVQTEDEISWQVGGAREEAYSAEINGDAITIQCWGGSVCPLEITASCQNATISATIQLEGI